MSLFKRLIWFKNNVRIKGDVNWEEPIEIGCNTVIDGTSGSVVLEGDNKIGMNATILATSTITNRGTPDFRSTLLKRGACVGANAVVKQGVVMGSNSILAAGSVAIESIPQDEIWGGVPAKFIKKRKRIDTK